MVSLIYESGLKESRDVDNNIILCDYSLHNILQPQVKNINAFYKVMGGCECCISEKKNEFIFIIM